MTEMDISIPRDGHHQPSLVPSLEADVAPKTAVLITMNQVTSIATPDDTEGNKKVKKIVRRKRRPARPQVDASAMKSEPPPQTGIIFNIWYNKWSGGDREDKYLSKTHAAGRCNIATDSGYTRGDRIPGSYFCLFFAKGLCPRGHECEYLHRLPGLHDLFNPNIDCFGRDKHSDYRDDMGGVGSFMRQNRTLYVGRIHVTDDIEEIVARHFAEWGQIDRIRVLTARGVAFVTFTNEANSQFAKEAMAHQSLDHNEILNVRWATMDPNPMAQKREARKIEEQAAEAVRKALPAEFVAEIEGATHLANKRMRIDDGFCLQGYKVPDDVWYAKAKVEAAGGDLAQLADGDTIPAKHEDAIKSNNDPPKESDGEGTLGGIFSNSTLAVLKGFKAQNNGGTLRTSSGADVPKESLVGYNSDSSD